MIATIGQEDTNLQTVNKNNSMKLVCGFEETSYQKKSKNQFDITWLYSIFTETRTKA